MAFPAQLGRMKVEGITQHGFRSSFRDGSSGCARADREVPEAALAQVVGSKTERAYARSELFDRRVALMDAWAAFATRKTGKLCNFCAHDTRTRSLTQQDWLEVGKSKNCAQIKV